MAAEKVPNPASDKADEMQEPIAQAAEAPCLNYTKSQPPVSGTVGFPSKCHLSGFVDGSNNVLSPSTDEEDLFGVPQDLPSEYGSSKDDGQNLFSYAPVLSPLESLLKLPAECDPSKCIVVDPGGKFSSSDILHKSKLLEDPLDKMPTVHTGPVSSDGNSRAVPDLSSGTSDLHDTHVTGPPLDMLHDNLRNCGEHGDSSDLFSETVKTMPSPSKEKQDLFDITLSPESLCTSVKSIPELGVSAYLPEEIDYPENANSSLKDDLSSKCSLSLDDEKAPVSKNIMQSDAQEELFGSGSVKHDFCGPRKEISEKVDDDLFLTTNIGSSIHTGDSGDELFSVGTNSSLSKENKNRTCLDKSDITEPKEICDIEDNMLFSSGDKRKQTVPTETDLFSNSIEDVNTRKLAALETVSNAGLFGGDSPESDDIFDLTSRKKHANSIIKGKLSGIVASSAKGSLFGDDDDDNDIFGSDKSSSKSAISPKPANTPLDDAG